MNNKRGILLKFIAVYVFTIIAGTLFFVYMNFVDLSKDLTNRYNDFVNIEQTQLKNIGDIITKGGYNFYNSLNDTLYTQKEKIQKSFGYINSYPATIATIFVMDDENNILFTNNNALKKDNDFALKVFPIKNNIQEISSFARIKGKYSKIYKIDSVGYLTFAIYLNSPKLIIGIIKDDAQIKKLLKEYEKEQKASIYKQIYVEVPGFFILFSLIILLLIYTVFKPLKKLKGIIVKMNEGDFDIRIDDKDKKDDEIGILFKSYDKLIKSLHKVVEFTTQIGKGNLDHEFTPLSEKDMLGKSLIQMRDNLKKVQEEERKRKKEDEQRNWIANGLAKFSDILRKNNDDLEELGDEIISELVHYVGAVQGGIFLYEDKEEELHLLSAYAYNRKKYLQKTVKFGEGLVGTCAIEKEKIYLKNIPEDYISITSGLGETPPKYLLLMPLKIEDKVYGVIELASLQPFEDYKIEFIEKVSESIASIINNLKINIKTKELLESSQQQAEELSAQEEEMRQNMEELQATQEEALRRERELKQLADAVDSLVLRAIISSDYKFAFVNSYFSSILGYSFNELSEKSITILDDENQSFSATVKEAFIHKTYREKTIIKLKNGEKEQVLLGFYKKEENNSLILIGARLKI